MFEKKLLAKIKCWVCYFLRLIHTKQKLFGKCFCFFEKCPKNVNFCLMYRLHYSRGKNLHSILRWRKRRRRKISFGIHPSQMFNVLSTSLFWILIFSPHGFEPQSCIELIESVIYIYAMRLIINSCYVAFVPPSNGIIWTIYSSLYGLCRIKPLDDWSYKTKQRKVFGFKPRNP